MRRTKSQRHMTACCKSLYRDVSVRPLTTCSLDSLLYQSKFDILFKAIWNHVPEFFLHYVEYFPTREYARFRHTLRVLGQCAEQLIAQKKRDPLVMEGGRPHDALSICGECSEYDM